MIHRRLSYTDSMRILLDGVSGVVPTRITEEVGVSRITISDFMKKKDTVRQDSIDKIAWFIWRRMNSTVLLSDSDRYLEEKINNAKMVKSHY